MFRRLATAAATVLAAGTLATLPTTTPPAHAAAPGGHLVYVKGGDVWVADPDGSGQVRVTDDGGYSSPSMSDNGRIAAVQGRSLVVLRADGSRVAQFQLPGLFVEGSCVTQHEGPPVKATISPDGTKVAWSQLRLSQCANGLKVDDLTAITDAVPAGAPQVRALVLGYDPSWIGSTKVVVDDEAVMTLVPVNHPDPKGIAWFDAYDLHGTYGNDINGPAVSRDGSRVAYLWDGDFERIYDHATTGNPTATDNPGIPSTNDVCVAATNIPRPQNGPILDDLVFSPDGNAMALVDDGDVTVVGGIGGSCDARAYSTPITGVSEVSWSGYTGTVAVDRTAPTAQVTDVAANHQQRSATVRFRGTDNVTPGGELRFRCQVDSGAKRSCTSPQAFTRLKPGGHTVKVWATDRAGNTSRTASQRFTVRR